MEQAPVELLEQLAYGVRARTLLVWHPYAPLRLYCACAGGVRRSPYLRAEALSTAAQPSALTHGMRGAQGAADSLIHEAPAAGTLTEDVP